MSTESRPRPEPVVLQVWDWNNTLGRPRIKELMMSRRGVDLREHNVAFDAYWDSLPAAQRVAEHRRFHRNHFIYRRSVEGRIDPPITLDAMAEFGSKGETYPHVEEMMAAHKERISQEFGVRVVTAVVTNAWAPVIRATPIVKNGVVDFAVGQEFVEEVRDGVRYARPVGSVSRETKSAAVQRLADSLGAAPRAVLYVGNGGLSDEIVMRYVKKEMGGLVVGVIDADEIHEPVLDKKMIDNSIEDRDLLTRLYYEGVVDGKVRADYRTGMQADRFLFRCLSQAARWALTSERADLSIVRDTGPGQAPITLGRDFVDPGLAG